jgi:ketose-bisphosphate aldolase
MALVPMAELLAHAKTKQYAVGAFNITEIASLQGVVQAAEEENSPAIIQTSASSTVKYYGYRALFEMVHSVAGASKIPIALHLDHCKDLEMVYACIDHGWTSVMYDGSSFPFRENLENSIAVVKRAHAKNVSVEGEIGAVWGVEDDIKVDEHPDMLADPDMAVQYANESGVDAFAPAIGTAHGLYKGEPKLDFERLQKILQRVNVPIVIHGGTGLSNEVFHRLINYGAVKINVSTQLKIGFFDGFKSYTESGGKLEPIKVLQHIAKTEKEIVKGFMRVFGSSGKV